MTNPAYADITNRTKNTIFHQFQAIWKLEKWEIYGYEALFRHSDYESPEQFFQIAREKNKLYEFDTLSIINAIGTFPFRKNHLLFLNVYPSTVLHDEFPAFIETIIKFHPNVLGQLVLELNESHVENHIWLIPELKERIKWLKSQGLLIALDDVGKGAASLQKMIEFKPDYIKLDRYFSMELSQNKEKQGIVSLMIHYCKKFNIEVILEGIEDPMDLAMSKMLKVPIVQGYLLGKPIQIEDTMHYK